MKIKIQDIVYHANIREVRERIINVADFAIPSDVIHASLGTAAGQLLVCTGAGVWEVIAAPGASGLTLVSDLGLAKKWALSAPSNVRIVQVCLNGGTALTTSNRAKFRIPAAMNGMNLTSLFANLGLDGSSGSSSSCTPTFSVQKGTTNMLSTNLTVDAGEYDSTTAAVPAVIDVAQDDVATGDIVIVETTVSGTGVTYAIVTLIFS